MTGRTNREAQYATRFGPDELRNFRATTGAPNPAVEAHRERQMQHLAAQAELWLTPSGDGPLDWLPPPKVDEAERIGNANTD